MAGQARTIHAPHPTTDPAAHGRRNGRLLRVGYPIDPPSPPPRPAAAVTAIACLCACPDSATARHIAESLVGERLAACVNLLPGVTSVYRWRGEVERAEEVLLLAKTTRERLQALSARIVELHPYELPEVIAVDIAGGLPAYLAWIADETRTGAEA